MFKVMPLNLVSSSHKFEDQGLPYEHMYKEETSKSRKHEESLERRERATSFPGFSPTPPYGATGRGENLGVRLGKVLTS